MKKGDLVTYVPHWSRDRSTVIEARVRRVHRDGSVSIEATFVRKPDGSTAPGYLGIKQRVNADVLSTTT
jgi:hypothetical protein